MNPKRYKIIAIIAKLRQIFIGTSNLCEIQCTAMVSHLVSSWKEFMWLADISLLARKTQMLKWLKSHSWTFASMSFGSTIQKFSLRDVIPIKDCTPCLILKILIKWMNLSIHRRLVLHISLIFHLCRHLTEEIGCATFHTYHNQTDDQECRVTCFTPTLKFFHLFFLLIFQ